MSFTINYFWAFSESCLEAQQILLSFEIGVTNKSLLFINMEELHNFSPRLKQVLAGGKCDHWKLECMNFFHFSFFSEVAENITPLSKPEVGNKFPYLSLSLSFFFSQLNVNWMLRTDLTTNTGDSWEEKMLSLRMLLCLSIYNYLFLLSDFLFSIFLSISLPRVKENNPGQQSQLPLIPYYLTIKIS